MRRKRIQMIYPTSRYNRFVQYYFRHRILQVIAAEYTPWRHPWYTAMRWDGDAETWVARIKPGACPSATSDGDPVVDTLVRYLAESDSNQDLDERVTAHLSDLPGLAVPVALMRPIGTDAAGVLGLAGESVPGVFRNLGVADAVRVRESGGGIVTETDGLISDRANARLLRAADLRITHDRLATRALPTVETAGVVSVDLTLEAIPNAKRDPYMSIVRKFEEAVARELAPVISGQVEDPGRDSELIATLYLLSPAGARPGAEPDGTWTPYVQHRVSWNLQYVTMREIVSVEPTRIDIAVPQLGQGALGRLGGAFTDAINDDVATIENALKRVGNSGRFLGM